MRRRVKKHRQNLAFILFFRNFAVTDEDNKWQSQHGGWRISERALLGLVAAFGGVGALAGMWGLRHKTKHRLFVVGVPAIMLVEFLLFNVVLYLITSSW